MDEETREEVIKGRTGANKYVTIYLHEADKRLVEEMIALTGMSRSAVFRAALHAYAPVMARLMR